MTTTSIANTEQYTYDKMEDIPDSFDYLVRFEPEYPEPPHSEEQHAYINSFPFLMQELQKRELRPYAKENRNREVRKPRTPNLRWNNENG